MYTITLLLRVIEVSQSDRNNAQHITFIHTQPHTLTVTIHVTPKPAAGRALIYFRLMSYVALLSKRWFDEL